MEARRAQRLLEQTAQVRAEEREFVASPPAALARESETAKANVPSVVVNAPSRQDYSSVSSSPVAVDDADVGEIAVTGVRARRDASGGSGPRNTVRPASSRGEEAADAADPQRTPEEWLESIRELRRQGRDRDADKEWDRFRAAWPEYEVALTDGARPPR